MSEIVPVIHWLAAVIVLAEALNKLERAAPLQPSLSPHQRLIDVLKVIAWTMLALGSAGALISPIMGGLGIRTEHSQIVTHHAPSIADAVLMVGVSVLIIRTRIKEG